jgi:hypothetical protein
VTSNGEHYDWQIPVTESILLAKSRLVSLTDQQKLRVTCDSGCTPWSCCSDIRQFDPLTYICFKDKWCVLADGKTRLKIDGVGTWILTSDSVDGKLVQFGLPGTLHVSCMPCSLFSDAHADLFHMHIVTRDTSHETHGKPMRIQIRDGPNTTSTLLAEVPLDSSHFKQKRAYTFEVYSPEVVLQNGNRQVLTPRQLGEVLCEPSNGCDLVCYNTAARTPDQQVNITQCEGQYRGKELLRVEPLSAQLFGGKRAPAMHTLTGAYNGIGSLERAAEQYGGQMRMAIEKVPLLQSLLQWMNPTAHIYGDFHH